MSCRVTSLITAGLSAWRGARPAARMVLAGWLVLLILILPAVAYSLATPFTLVDDYGDWCVVLWTKWPVLLKKWLASTFWGTPQRYRPFFEFYNWGTWRLMGDHPAVHHLARWVVLGAIVWLLVRAIRLARGAAAGFAGLLAAWLLLISANQPVARLAPQELNSVFFLALCFLGVTRRLHGSNASLAAAPWQDLALIMCGFVGLSISKESNMAAMAWILLWLAVQHGRPFNLRSVIVLSALGTVLAFTAWRVSVVARSAAYGTSPLDLVLLHRNAAWLFGDALQWNISWVATAGLVLILALGAVPVLRSLKSGIWLSRERVTLFAWGILAAATLSCLTSWRPVLRYWYPILFGISLVAGLGVAAAMEVAESRRRATKAYAATLAAVWLTYMTAANYAGYLWQFAAQHHQGHVDKAMLNGVTQQLEQGKQVAIGYRKRDPEPEMVPHARAYFTEFMPYFHGAKRLKLANFDRDSETGTAWLVSPRVREKGMKREAVFGYESRYALFEAACVVSAAAQRRKGPYMPGDAGTHGPEYAWYLWSAGSVAGTNTPGTVTTGDSLPPLKHDLPEPSAAQPR